MRRRRDCEHQCGQRLGRWYGQQMRTVERVVSFNKPKVLDRMPVTGLHAIGGRDMCMISVADREIAGV